MTCIVALKGMNGSIIMGADSLGVGGLSKMNRVDPKIYRVGKMLIGFTSSYRMGQILGYSFNPPEHRKKLSIEKYMNTLFIDEVRSALKKGGYARKYHDEEAGGTFLVAYKGRIFEIENDFQVGERTEDYNAVGCGADLALGSLYTSVRVDVINPEERVIMALESAAAFSAGVGGPFLTKVLQK